MQLDFHLGRAASVEMGVFSPQGRRIATILSARLEAGSQTARWDGRVEGGARAPAGVYQLRLAIDGRPVTKRMVLMQ